MGVPVVTLTGDSHAHNVGATILRQVGHEELIAHTQEAFVEAALRLANDPQRLQSIRNSLREKMQRSYLCNARAFTRNLEDVYSHIWRKHCVSQLNAGTIPPPRRPHPPSFILPYSG